MAQMVSNGPRGAHHPARALIPEARSAALRAQFTQKIPSVLAHRDQTTKLITVRKVRMRGWAVTRPHSVQQMGRIGTARPGRGASTRVWS